MGMLVDNDVIEQPSHVAGTSDVVPDGDDGLEFGLSEFESIKIEDQKHQQQSEERVPVLA